MRQKSFNVFIVGPQRIHIQTDTDAQLSNTVLSNYANILRKMQKICGGNEAREIEDEARNCEAENETETEMHDNEAHNG